jgi:hypothetical protein
MAAKNGVDESFIQQIYSDIKEAPQRNKDLIVCRKRLKSKEVVFYIKQEESIALHWFSLMWIVLGNFDDAHSLYRIMFKNDLSRFACLDGSFPWVEELVECNFFTKDQIEKFFASGGFSNPKFSFLINK